MPKLLDHSQVSIYLLCLGLPRMITAYYSGILYDKLGWKFITSASVLVNLVGSVLVVLGVRYSWVWCIDISAGFFGSMEMTGNILLNSTIMVLWKENSPNAFAVSRFVNSIAVGLALLASLVVNWWQLMVFNLILTGISAGCFWVIYHFGKNSARYEPLEEMESEMKNEK